MSTLEIVKDVRELGGNRFLVECENSLNDMIGAHLVGRVEIARLRRRLEWPHDDPRGVGAQMKRLPIQEGCL
ncbi:hypothetical protein [Bradyrhizobium sp. USDA 329]|uniref:hypothetical protein n=1 Tax=unclassified Bradyrhizobium TaxID=2631580 RepID=UPI0035192E68